MGFIEKCRNQGGAARGGKQEARLGGRGREGFTGLEEEDRRDLLKHLEAQEKELRERDLLKHLEAREEEDKRGLLKRLEAPRARLFAAFDEKSD